MTRTQVPERRGAEAKQPPARLLRFGRILEEVLDLALGNPADLIQMETALALFHFRVTLRAEKRVNNHGDGGESGATHGKRESPIGRHGFQRYNSIDEIPGTAKNTSHGWATSNLTDGLQRSQAPLLRILAKSGPPVNHSRGGCTGLRNTPIPETLTSTVSPVTKGPTPAGVPVAMMSPGRSVIMREIQRTRKGTG